MLKASPPYLPPVVQGGQGSTTINVTSVGTASTTVTLYVDGLTPGITAAFSPANTVTASPGASAGSTVTLSVAAGTLSGPYPLSIRGVSGTETIVIPLGFGVMPKIGADQGYATVTINPPRGRPGDHIGISSAGFTAGATITLSAAPPGAPTSIDITPGTITVEADGTWATEITVPPAAQVPTGTYSIKATDGTRSARASFQIVPADVPEFFLNLSPPFLDIVRGQSATATFRVSSKNGFQDTITFKANGLAPGVAITFKDATGTTVGKFAGSAGGIQQVTAPTPLTPRPGEDLMVTVLVEIDNATTLGPYSTVLEANTGTIFRAIPLAIMVKSAGASLVL